MNIKYKVGRDDIAIVYIGEMNGRFVECVESVQPPLQRHEKWVLIVSTLFGCPVKCRFCDSGGYYKGILNEDELWQQLDFLVESRFPERIVKTDKFKVQFARMGEPAFNMHVIEVLKKLPDRYSFPGVIPSVSTVAPEGTQEFFDALLDVQHNIYIGNFQMQFSLHTTDESVRDWIIPVKKWNFNTIAAYGEKFFIPGGKKITLNFALAENMKVCPLTLKKYFDPHKYIIKLTPVNPTYRARENKLVSYMNKNSEVTPYLREEGYEVIESIGELEENNIGSNCGQHIMNYLNSGAQMDAYQYQLEEFNG